MTPAGPSGGICRSASRSDPESPGIVLFRSQENTTKRRGGGISRGRDIRHGQPDFNNSEGRPMWIRPSDGRLVYLRCTVGLCTKMDFKTIHALLTHVAKVHKHKAMFASYNEALEMCGLLREERMASDALATNPQGPSHPASRSDEGRKFSREGDVQDDEEPDSIKKEVLIGRTSRAGCLRR